MTSDAAPLVRLAAWAGVMPAYDDVFGVAHAATRETLLSVLGALGIDAATDAEAERALAEIESRSWREELDAVIVLESGRAFRIGIASAVDDAETSRTWSLTAEDGTETTGSFDFGELAIDERRSIDGRAYERRTFELDASLAPGYYALAVRSSRGERTSVVAVAPRTCWMPEILEKRGVWGLAIQLYALRSERNWGIGDFTDLGVLCAAVRDAGGAAVGLNPLHELRFGTETGTSPSPYAPTSRAFLNWIYLDIELLPGYSAADVDRAQLEFVRASDLVEYAAVADLKRRAARSAFERFCASSRPNDLAAAFDAFVASGGDAPVRAATFAVLADRFERTPGATGDWMSWPAEFRDPASAQVAAFARERADDVAFELYLQWQADVQLARCAAVAPRPIGLYRDLAVGASLGSADTWSLQGTMTRAASVGAPPDLLNVRGQNWGVAPFDPLALRRAAYAPFVALLRANMRHAGALRIDHVMALARLYWVPEGMPATEGAYVAYRLDEMLGIVALESRRARCMVIGEDLGTVPEGFRERLAAKGLLSYRLLPFERDDAGFHAPDAYPSLALASLGTHDLPPIGAYWTASDVALRARLGLLKTPAEEAHERERRVVERGQLLAALAASDGGDAERDARLRGAAECPDDRAVLAELALAANRFLSRSAARLLMVQLEDVFGEVDQINVPTTVDEHPNWRRRVPVPLERLARDARFVALAAALREERGSF